MATHNKVYAKVAIAATLAGTAAEMGDGTFANGAMSAAYVAMFNHGLGHGIQDNPAIAVAEEALKDGHLTLSEANRIWRANIDPNFELTVDATQLRFTNTSPFESGIAKGRAVGVGDFLVHGSNKIVMNSRGDVSIVPGSYDFSPNPRGWYSSWSGYAVRNVETFMGLFVATNRFSESGVSFTINYRGSPTFVLSE